LASVQRRFPALKGTADFQDLLNDPTIDAIAVATPVSSHFQLGMATLKAGKHLWLEKPMTETSLQARQLVEEAERRRRVLFVDHTFIYTGAVRKMNEIIKAGDLGRMYYYDSIRVNLGLFQRDVNVISDLGVHDFSILDDLLGEHPVAVSASGINHFPGTPENLAYITLFYDSGTIAHVNVSWLAPVKVRQILIGGSKRMITYDDLQPSEKVKVYDKGISFTDDPEQIYQMRVGYRTGDMWAPNLDTSEALRVAVDHFVDCVERGTQPRTSGHLGVRVVELIEAATSSMRARGETVHTRRRGTTQ
jgi:predicted dehydrogenase